jgi:hypothetical protein
MCPWLFRNMVQKSMRNILVQQSVILVFRSMDHN